MAETILATNALTTVEKVKQQGSGIRSPDPTQDDAIRFLINEASAAMMQYSNCEFKSLLVGSQPRSFRLKRNYATMGGYIDFGQYNAQTISAVSVETQPTGSNIALSAAILQYQAMPIEQWNGTYTGITIYSPTASWGAAYDAGIEHTAQVTGVWGFSSVPADIEGACVEQVKQWLLTGYQVSQGIGIPGETPGQATGGPRHQLAYSTLQTLDRYGTLLFA